MKNRQAVLLIGHGAPARDTPKALIEELKRLEAKRDAEKSMTMSSREAEVDAIVRDWPRTADNDAYRTGIEEIAAGLRAKLPDFTVETCYNEFCAPSLERALESLAERKFSKVVLITTMFTRGGVHSESEIPAAVAEAKKRFAGLDIRYAWPFDLGRVAGFLSDQIRACDDGGKKP